MRYTLLAALCWQRQREITDTLVELLIHIAHRVGARAEKKVDGELLEYAKKVLGKTKLLYKIAKAATGHPDGAVILGGDLFDSEFLNQRPYVKAAIILRQPGCLRQSSKPHNNCPISVRLLRPCIPKCRIDGLLGMGVPILC